MKSSAAPGSLAVSVTDPQLAYREFDCFHLGHDSWKCGACRKGYVHVRSATDHDEACDRCGGRITVRRRG